MRILFILHSHPSLQAGGTEIFARDLFRTLRRSGVEGLFLAGTAAPQRPPSPGTPFQTVSARRTRFWSGPAASTRFSCRRPTCTASHSLSQNS